jgi:hypothetical protein
MPSNMTCARAEVWPLASTASKRNLFRTRKFARIFTNIFPEAPPKRNYRSADRLSFWVPPSLLAEENLGPYTLRPDGSDTDFHVWCSQLSGCVSTGNLTPGPRRE